MGNTLLSPEPALNKPRRPSVSESFGKLTVERTVLLTARSSSVIFIGKLFMFIGGFFLSLILARFLGAENYGLYKIALTTVTIIGSFALLGLDVALLRFTALFSSRQDEPRTYGMLQLGLGLPAIGSLLLGVLAFLLAHPIATLIFKDEKLTALIRLAAPLLPLLAINRMFSFAVKGFNKPEYEVIADRFSGSVIRLAILMVFVLIGLTAARAIVAYSIAELFITIFYFYLLNRLFSLIRPFNAGIREGKSIFKFSLPVYLSSLVETFSNNFQTVLLGALSTVFNAGVFALSSQVGLVGSMFHSSVGTAAMPLISALYDRKEMSQLKKLYQTASKWTFTINLPLFLGVCLFSREILSIFGKAFEQGAAALVILSWANLVSFGTGTSGGVLDMTGYSKLKFVNSLIATSTTLILNFLLIRSYGLIGAAIATLAAAAIINFLRMGEVFYLFRMLPYNLSFLKPVAAGLATLIVSLLTRHWIPETNNYLFIIINISILMVIYFAIIFSLGLSAEDQLILSRFSSRLFSIITRRKPSSQFLNVFPARFIREKFDKMILQIKTTFQHPSRLLSIEALILLAGLALSLLLGGLISIDKWYFAVVLVMMIPTAILLLRSPYVAVIIWLLIFPFFLHTLSYNGRYMYWALHRALVPLALIVAISQEWFRIKRRPSMKFGLVEFSILVFIGYAFFNVLALSRSTSPTLVLFYDDLFIPVCMFGLVRYIKPNDKELKLLGWVALFTVLTQTGLSAAEWFSPGILPVQWQGFEGVRTVGTFRNPSVYATVLMMAALLILQFALQSKSRPIRLIFFAVFCWALFSIVFSFSRDSWVGLSLVVLGLLIRQPKITARLLVPLLVVVTILGSTVLAKEVRFAVERFEDRHTAEDRIIQTFASLRMIAEKPLLGWGYQNYDLYNERYKTRIGDIALQTGSTSHNTFLTILVEFGLVGLVLYIFPAVWLLVRSIRAWKKIPEEGFQNKNWLVFLWLFVLFHFTVNNFIDMVRYHLFGITLWWLVLGLIANTLDRVEESQTHEPIDAISS